MNEEEAIRFAGDWETGEPVEQDEDEPDLSKFSL